MARVAHAHLVSVPAHDRGKRLDTQGRKRHDPNPAAVGRRRTEMRREDAREVLVPDVDEEGVHGLGMAGGGRGFLTRIAVLTRGLTALCADGV